MWPVSLAAGVPIFPLPWRSPALSCKGGESCSQHRPGYWRCSGQSHVFLGGLSCQVIFEKGNIPTLHRYRFPGGVVTLLWRNASALPGSFSCPATVGGATPQGPGCLHMGQTRQEVKRQKRDFFFLTSTRSPVMTLFIIRLKIVSMQRIPLDMSAKCTLCSLNASISKFMFEFTSPHKLGLVNSNMNSGVFEAESVKFSPFSGKLHLESMCIPQITGIPKYKWQKFLKTNYRNT